MKYSVHILTIKLWELEGIKDEADMSIAKKGADQYNTETYNVAAQKIKDVQDAINCLKRMDSTLYPPL